MTALLQQSDYELEDHGRIAHPIAYDKASDAYRLGDAHLLGNGPGRRPQRAPSARGRVVPVDAGNVTFCHC